MRNQQSSAKVRERRLRAKYRRNLRVAIILSLIIGLAGGFMLGRTVEQKSADKNTAKPLPTATAVIEATEEPEVTEAPSLTLSLDPTAEPTAEPTEVPTEAPTQAPTATPAPQVIVVPYGSTQNLTAQIHSDGTVRKSADAQTYETLNFSLRVTRYMTPEYYQSNYATQYQMQGDEAGVEFELLLNDYMGTQTILPQDLMTVNLETANGVSEQGFQLTDAEIHGDNKVTINTNIPKMFYKRFKFSQSVGDMRYLSVTTYVDGAAQKYLFELGTPIRPTATPTVEPTPVVNYSTLTIASRGQEVVDLQAKLIELGYLEGTADGRFGEMTQRAIKAAQEAFGMEKTGVADNAFQQKLFSTEAE